MEACWVWPTFGASGAEDSVQSIDQDLRSHEADVGRLRLHHGAGTASFHSLDHGGNVSLATSHVHKLVFPLLFFSERRGRNGSTRLAAIANHNEVEKEEEEDAKNAGFRRLSSR